MLVDCLMTVGVEVPSNYHREATLIRPLRLRQQFVHVLPPRGPKTVRPSSPPANTIDIIQSRIYHLLASGIGATEDGLRLSEGLHLLVEGFLADVEVLHQEIAFGV